MSRTTKKKIKIINVKRSGTLNSYAMAIYTAILAGIFSVIGGYFTSEFQAKRMIAQKQHEYRIFSYNAFLDKTDRTKAPAISQILYIGSMVDHLATDGEIQAFENRVVNFLVKYNTQDIYWQLNADFNTLRLHGSHRVDEICDDILKTLLLRDEEINWSTYSPEVVTFHNRWKAQQEEGIEYGWEGMVAAEERLMFVIASKLTQVLVEQLRLEFFASST